MTANGNITAKKAGTTTITITEEGGATKTVKIRVTKIRSREVALAPWYQAMKDQAAATKNSIYDWKENGQTIEGSKKYGTCITFPSVSLQRAGILSSGEYITSQDGSGFSDKKKSHSINIIKKHSKAIEYIDLGSGKSAKELGDKLKKGDIVNYYNHTQVYMGKNKNGIRTYNSAGQGAKENYNIARIGLATSEYDNTKIGMIFRIKTYTVNVTCINGTVSGGNQYMANQKVTIKYKPDSGKTLKKVIVDGKELDINKYKTQYTISKIDKNTRIKVIYE